MVRFVLHVYVSPTQIFRGEGMTRLAEGSGKFWVVPPASDVMLLDLLLAPAKQTTISFLTFEEPSCCLNWLFIHHDEDSGMA